MWGQLGSLSRSASAKTSLDLDASHAPRAGGQRRPRLERPLQGDSPNLFLSRIKVGSRLRSGHGSLSDRRFAAKSWRCFRTSSPGRTCRPLVTRFSTLSGRSLIQRSAVNSLNQTIYFLRRVIEENYADDLSPGYVHHDSDVVWLDPDSYRVAASSVGDSSGNCRPRPSPDDVDRSDVLYRGRFALDFEYEEWADGYRDTSPRGIPRNRRAIRCGRLDVRALRQGHRHCAAGSRSRSIRRTDRGVPACASTA